MLRTGDEQAFVDLIEKFHGPLLRLARCYVSSHAVAEEVVQECWLGALEGLSLFEARSSFKTWLFRILTNRAKTRGMRERRTIPFASIGEGDNGEPFELAEDPSCFGPNRHWSSPPQSWDLSPEACVLSGEVRASVEAAIRELPMGQRDVITLRDVEGWDSYDVCQTLGLTEANQRVLLHRARAKVRRSLESYFAERRRAS
jgi:RNA polymerase sigma-70 factor (ECF subfamily)